MTDSYQSYARRKGFNPIQVSNQNIQNIRNEGNRMIAGMEAQRNAEARNRNAVLSQMKENQQLEAANRRENYQAEVRYYDSLKDSARSNYEIKRADLDRKAQADAAIYQSLSGLSETAGKVFEDVSKFKFNQDYEDELSKILSGQIDPNKQVVQTVGETALEVQEADYQGKADVLQATGTDPLMVERVRAASPGRQYARDQIAAMDAQVNFPLYLDRVFNTDETTEIFIPGRGTITPVQARTSEERVVVGNVLAMKYLKESGLYGLKPEFLTKTLLSFRKTIAADVQKIRQVEQKTLEEERISQQEDLAFDKINAPQLTFGNLYRSYSRGTNERGELMTRGEARQKTISFFVNARNPDGSPRFTDQELDAIFSYSFEDQPNNPISSRYSQEVAEAKFKRQQNYIELQRNKDALLDAEQREVARNVELRLQTNPEELTEDTLNFIARNAKGNKYLTDIAQRYSQSTPTAIEQQSIKDQFDGELEDRSLTKRRVLESRLTIENKQEYIKKIDDLGLGQGGLSKEEEKDFRKYATAQLAGAIGFTGQFDEFENTQIPAIRKAVANFRKNYALGLQGGTDDPYQFAQDRFDIELGKGEKGLYAIGGPPRSRVFKNFTAATTPPELGYNALTEKIKADPKAYQNDVLIPDDQVKRFINEATVGRIPTMPNVAFAASNAYGGKLSAMDIMLAQADRLGLTVPPALVRNVKEIKGATATSPLQQYLLNYKPNYTRTQISLIDQQPGAWRQPENLNPVIVQGSRSDYIGSSDVIDSGYKDYQNRPIMLAPAASQAFNKMVADGMPLDRITNVYRDESEYLRLRSEGYGAVPNSAHNYGEAMDVHGAAGEWLKQYGPQYGWYLIDYDGSHGGHFEYRGIQ